MRRRPSRSAATASQRIRLNLVERFERARRALVSALREANEGELERSARHPRLGTPMRLIDLAYVVAEHDDHHLARLRELTTTHGTHSREL